MVMTATRRAAAALVGLMAGLAAAVPAGIAADAARGQAVFRQCQGCHAVGPDARNKAGPHLNGIVGRTAGSVAGFSYSGAMVQAGASGLAWTPESLHSYLETPDALVSQTSMRFRGLKDADDRTAVIAYLRRFSDAPSATPAAMPPERPAGPGVDPAILAIEGDPDHGAYLAAECLTCHRRDGADAGIPSITNWPVADFVTAMHAYKNRIRPDPVMQMMAGHLSNEEIASLAAYFASLGGVGQ